MQQQVDATQRKVAELTKRVIALEGGGGERTPSGNDVDNRVTLIEDYLHKLHERLNGYKQRIVELEDALFGKRDYEGENPKDFQSRKRERDDENPKDENPSDFRREDGEVRHLPRKRIIENPTSSDSQRPRRVNNDGKSIFIKWPTPEQDIKGRFNTPEFDEAKQRICGHFAKYCKSGSPEFYLWFDMTARRMVSRLSFATVEDRDAAFDDKDHLFETYGYMLSVRQWYKESA